MLKEDVVFRGLDSVPGPSGPGILYQLLARRKSEKDKESDKERKQKYITQTQLSLTGDGKRTQ